MLRKIFPFDAESSFFNSFSIIFLAEGFRAAESGLFTSLCLDFTNKLLEYPPFNFTRINSNWLSIYTSFAPSNNSGPAINTTAAADRTAFGSTLNTTTGAMAFNQAAINTQIDNANMNYGGSSYRVSDILSKGGMNIGHTGTLVVLLLPPMAGHAEGADFESTPLETDYYFIATSADGLWHQAIIRGICKLLGAGDEYELAGVGFLQPDVNAQKAIRLYPNVQYFNPVPTTLTSASKWYRLFSVVKRGLPVEVHRKAGDTSMPDDTLSAELVSYDKPIFHEGGGGYRTTVYRSCKDSLMRRKLGSLQLPLRSTPLALSPASFHFIKNVIV